MSNKEQKLHKQRNYWLDKLETTLNELCFLSMEGKRQHFQAQNDDLQTSFMILWRMDRKLEQLRADERAERTSDEEVS